MVALKGILFGLGLSIVGTITYFAVLFVRIAHSAAAPAGSTVGVDVATLVRRGIVHNPGYWFLILALLATGCAVVYLRRYLLV
jgi:uncharacterized membrane protein